MSFFDGFKRFLGLGGNGNGVGEKDMEKEMISCQDALSLINEFIDGELEEISYTQVKAHFDVCQRCYPHLRLEESFRQALHRAAEVEQPPEGLRQKVSELLADASTSE